ncbi:MAG: type II secretion system protein [Candidatus Nomurabacteria bacterium]|nr:type II secretion system protein [Candidatus Nomurabacteria bacterium]
MDKFKKYFIHQNFQKKISGGFTLLELMIVVAIIAILSSVILVALGDSRNKGVDASVKSNLDTIRSESELFYSNNDNSFLPAGGSTFGIATCPVYNASGTNMLSKDKTIADALAEAVKRGTNGSSCYNSNLNWAMAVGLKTDANTSWCVDSGGNSKQVSLAPANAINGTTFVCN